MRRTASIRDGAAWAARLGLFGVLVYAGMLKVHDPAAAAAFLGEMTTIRSSMFVRSAGAAELAAGAAMIIWPTLGVGPACAAAIFAVFGMLHGLAWRYGVQGPCGCLGKGVMAETPRWAWMLLSLAGVAACAWLVSPAVRRGRGMEDTARTEERSISASGAAQGAEA